MMKEAAVETKDVVGRYYVIILLAKGLISEEQAEEIFKRFLLRDNIAMKSKDSGKVA